MSELRQKMIREMDLRNFSDSTKRAYVSAVAGLVRHHKKAPDQIGREEIEDYLLHLKNGLKLSWSTCNVALSGIRFFFSETLKADWAGVDLPPRNSQFKVPAVLSQGQVMRIIDAAENMKHRILLMTTYSAGLRVSEVVSLKPEHIESERMMIRVEQAKGNKDRYTLLSNRLLGELRQYWKIYRPKQWLFPSSWSPEKHIDISSAQKIYYKAKKQAGIQKGKGIHVLRHCFATHLLEAGYDVRRIQILMGHRALSTTMTYLHVTRKGISSITSPLDLPEFDDNRKNPWEKEADDGDKAEIM